MKYIEIENGNSVEVISEDVIHDTLNNFKGNCFVIYIGKSKFNKNKINEVFCCEYYEFMNRFRPE